MKNQFFQCTNNGLSYPYVENASLCIYLEMPQKVGKEVGIHFYENVLSEINLSLPGCSCSFESN